MFSFLKPKKTGTAVTFTISGMHCPSCSMNIDGELEDTDGVISAQTSYAKSQTEVVFDATQTSSEKLSEIIAELGYSAEKAVE